MTRHLTFAIVGLTFVFLAQPIQAKSIESYIGLYGGTSLAQPLREVTGNGPLSSVKLTDLDLSRTGIAGVKMGFFLPGKDRWWGVETEVFYTSPHIKQQDITFTAPGFSGITTNFAGARVRIATWAVNWILRYPGTHFQPYIGAGPGIFWGRMSGSELGSGSDTSLGLNALAGARLLLSRHVALFGEYKYNRVGFDFGGTATIHALYQAHHGVVGLSFHF
jgi:opacity protein-like surface antigen